MIFKVWKKYSIYIGSILGEKVGFVLEKENKKKYIQVTYSLLDKKPLIFYQPCDNI